MNTEEKIIIVLPVNGWGKVLGMLRKGSIESVGEEYYDILKQVDCHMKKNESTIKTEPNDKTNSKI